MRSRSSTISGNHSEPAAFTRNSMICRRCSMMDSMKSSSKAGSTPTATMRVLNLCHCCSTATAAMTIHSKPVVTNSKHINGEVLNGTRKVSTSSSSSTVNSPANRKVTRAHSSASPSKALSGNSATNSSIITHSNSQSTYSVSTKMKQMTVWNQQEKAFRQLFAIVFGFTCCFLPYFILYMVVAFCGSCVSERIVTATIWLGYVNSTINPFLYALSNKHFRRTFNRILKRDQRRQSYYN